MEKNMDGLNSLLMTSQNLLQRESRNNMALKYPILPVGPPLVDDSSNNSLLNATISPAMSTPH